MLAVNLGVSENRGYPFEGSYDKGTIWGVLAGNLARAFSFRHCSFDLLLNLSLGTTPLCHVF